MGIKSLISLQMIPWCFPLLWNHISCLPPRSGGASSPGDDDDNDQARGSSTIKLIKSDGMVKIYHQPIIASDLMEEFPKHLICHSDSFFIGQKIQALSEKDKLQLGQKYFLLPNHFFQSVLSFVTIASFASASISQSLSSSNQNKKITHHCQPFDIRKTASGSLQIRVSDEFISKLMEVRKIKDNTNEEEEERLVQVGNEKSLGNNKVINSDQLKKEYSQLVGLSRQWKPKLETITESKKRRKLAASLGLGFGIGTMIMVHKSNNKKSKSSSSDQLMHVITTTSSSNSSTKVIKMSKGKK